MTERDDPEAVCRDCRQYLDECCCEDDEDSCEECGEYWDECTCYDDGAAIERSGDVRPCIACGGSVVCPSDEIPLCVLCRKAKDQP